MDDLKIGANPEKELDDLEREAISEAGQVEVMSQALQPEPEQESEPAIETKLLIMPAVTVAAAMAAPNWELGKPADELGGVSPVEYLSECYADTIDAYFPDFGENMPPWAGALIATGSIIAMNAHKPRFKEEEAKEEKTKADESPEGFDENGMRVARDVD